MHPLILPAVTWGSSVRTLFGHSELTIDVGRTGRWSVILTSAVGLGAADSSAGGLRARACQLQPPGSSGLLPSLTRFQRRPDRQHYLQVSLHARPPPSCRAYAPADPADVLDSRPAHGRTGQWLRRKRRVSTSIPASFCASFQR